MKMLQLDDNDSRAELLGWGTEGFNYESAQKYSLGQMRTRYSRQSVSYYESGPVRDKIFDQNV